MDVIEAKARIAVSLLVRREFHALENLTRGENLTAAEMERALDDYGRRLIFPPDEAWAELETYHVPGVEPERVHVVMDLWTEEEGRSDLSLEMDVIVSVADTYRTVIRNIHVM